MPNPSIPETHGSTTDFTEDEIEILRVLLKKGMREKEVKMNELATEIRTLRQTKTNLEYQVTEIDDTITSKESLDMEIAQSYVVWNNLLDKIDE